MRRFVFLLSVLLLAGCSRQKASLVGITCSRTTSGATLLSPAYTEAVSRAGGVPMVIPTVGSAEEAQAIISGLDGIIFSGGEDVSPALYGEGILNGTVSVDAIRDRSDSLLARAALASGKPVFAICRGGQLMNVMLGGSLYQDIPAQVPGNVGHGGGARHKIGLEEGSVLYKLYGPDSLEVNSFHHQAVKAPAAEIRITARSADGLVEAYETGQVLAVQFHPEKMLREGDDKWLALFRHFVDQCRDRR